MSFEQVPARRVDHTGSPVQKRSFLATSVTTGADILHSSQGSISHQRIPVPDKIKP